MKPRDDPEAPVTRTNKIGEFFVGCPIWAFKGWVGNFFPTGTKSADFLREYARRLTTVEGNTTFYAVPSATTIERWRDATHADFQFAPKIPRTVSHNGPLKPKADEALRFAEHMRGLDSRLGPMFLQLPPRYSPSYWDDLRPFIAAWPSEFELALEVRNRSWFESPHYEALNALLEEHNVARVLIDTRPIRDLPGARVERGNVEVLMNQARERKPDVPLLPDLTARFAFVRFIGHPDVAANAPFLDEWAEHIIGWLRDGADVFAFCHCPDETHSPALCRDLHARIAARVEVAPLPWDAADQAEPGGQRRLF